MPEASHTASRRTPGPADRPAFERAAALALAAIQRQYPFHLVHVVESDDDLRPPRELHPAFGGAFDWHSCVHGHWCVIRAMRLGIPPAFESAATAVLDDRLSAQALRREHQYLATAGREGFERPYGLAWLLQLAAELREWGSERARRWLGALEPLEAQAAARLGAWWPKLPGPVRSGEHSQSAFAMALALDRARGAGDGAAAAVIEAAALRFFGEGEPAAVHLEPSAHDFLSPALGEADLMRRVLAPPKFAAWLQRFLSADSAALERWLAPVVSPDPADGKLSHLNGLNLSRAWMLEGVARALAPEAPLAARLALAAERHLAAGLPSVSADHYEGSHWLGSFAMYALTRRGLAATP
jgi:hypothetical protein